MNSQPTFKLTPEERALLDRIDFSLEGDAIQSLEASAQLMPLLLQRKAIPAIRWRYFTEPELNIGVSRSRAEVFERNGTRGTAIFGHGNFIAYLHYFLFGPNLPADMISDFQRRVQGAGGFISSSDWPELDGIIKQGIRNHRLDPREACEEVHKLALECGMDTFMSRRFRDTAMKIRR